MCSHDTVLGALRSLDAPTGKVAASPWGPDDEIGRLNLVDAGSRDAALRLGDATRTFDLAVDYFIGMPSWTAAGDQPYQAWMTHTPSGTRIDNTPGVPPEQNDLVAYSGDAISMYTHTGTHIDALNHFGYNGAIYNGFTERDSLTSRGWTRGGMDKHPPIVARGVLLDIAAMHGVDELEPSHQIGRDDLVGAARRQGVELRLGDVVLVRTGRIRAWPDHARFVTASPGLNLEGARYLAQSGAMMVGTDNASFEYTPHDAEAHWNPVHCYMLAEAGIPLLEVAVLEEIAAEGLSEFVFVCAALKLRGATGAPVRPMAFPLRDR